MKRQVAYGTLGVALGVLAYTFGSWAGAPIPETHVLTAKIETRATTVSPQSMILSIMVVAGAALFCAVAVWLMAKRKLS